MIVICLDYHGEVMTCSVLAFDVYTHIWILVICIRILDEGNESTRVNKIT